MNGDDTPFARMPDANLKMTLDAARRLMQRSKQETWGIQSELAEKEISRRASAGAV